MHWCNCLGCVVYSLTYLILSQTRVAMTEDSQELRMMVEVARLSLEEKIHPSHVLRVTQAYMTLKDTVRNICKLKFNQMLHAILKDG